MGDPEETPPVQPSRLSKTPSWITLGFVLGALFVLALPREEPRRPATPPAKTQTVRLERPKLTQIEAVFADWGQHAVWSHDITEVALWDTDTRSYTICYEVLRSGDDYYFRSIPKLTRPILTHGVPANSPLLFTETEESRREWLQRGQYESLTR